MLYQCEKDFQVWEEEGSCGKRTEVFSGYLRYPYWTQRRQLLDVSVLPTVETAYARYVGQLISRHSSEYPILADVADGAGVLFESALVSEGLEPVFQHLPTIPRIGGSDTMETESVRVADFRQFQQNRANYLQKAFGSKTPR